MSQPTVRILTDHDHTPIHPSASDPPTPTQDSAIELGNDDHFKVIDKFQTIGKWTPLSSHPPSAIAPSQDVKPLFADSAVAAARQNFHKNAKILQPSPRRLGSHPVLRRATSDVSSMRWSRIQDCEHLRTMSVSPGPPPPRSPLRIKKYPQSIENLLREASVKLEDAKPHESDDALKLEGAGSVKAIAYHDLAYSMPPREGSRTASTTSSDAVSPAMSRRWNIRDYKRNKPLQVVDAVVKVPSPKPPRRRLRRARPQESRPLDLSKIRVQTSIKQESQRPQSRFGHMPVMPQMSHGVALPIEVVNVPRVVYARKPVAIPVKGRKSPAPRPRSARMPPRGPRGLQTPPRSKSPAKRQPMTDEDAPAMPTIPPKRELPPTPKTHVRHASGSVYSTSSAAPEPLPTKALPALPLSVLNTTFPSPPSSARSTTFSTRPSTHKAALSTATTSTTTTSQPPQSHKHSQSSGGGTINHIYSQSQSQSQQQYRTSGNTSSSSNIIHGGLEARLEAVERQNRMLEAALMAVLKTNGTQNGCPYHSDGTTSHGNSHGRGHGHGHSHSSSRNPDQAHIQGHNHHSRAERQAQSGPTDRDFAPRSLVQGGGGVGPPGHPAFSGQRQNSGSSRLSSSGASSAGGGALDLYMSTRGRRGL